MSAINEFSKKARYGQNNEGRDFNPVCYYNDGLRECYQ